MKFWKKIKKKFEKIFRLKATLSITAAQRISAVHNEEFCVKFKAFSIFEEEDVPFPVRGTELFVSRDDFSNAFIERDWEAYVRGYLQAANILVEYVGQSGMDSDTLVFPIVFLFRQHLELRIKSLLKAVHEYRKQNEPLKMSHDIQQLWMDCSSPLKQIFGDQYLREIGTIEQIIDQFSRIDPKSEGFRYPVDTKGKQSFPEGFDNINLGHLAKTLNGIAAFLSDLQSKISYRYAKENSEQRAK